MAAWRDLFSLVMGWWNAAPPIPIGTTIIKSTVYCATAIQNPAYCTTVVRHRTYVVNEVKDVVVA